MSVKEMDAPPLTEDELNEVYNWVTKRVDTIPLSRPKKHIGRDFADGVLLAEVVAHYVPRIVDLHNYSQAHSVQQKQYNWSTLNNKVFRKMGFQLTQNDIDAVIQAQPEAVERVLKVVQVKIQIFLEQKLDRSIEMPQPVPQQPKGGKIVSKAPQQPPQQHHNNQGQQIQERDMIIQDQRETIEILELKIQKLEQLVKLKDSKIQTLQQKMQQSGIK